MKDWNDPRGRTRIAWDKMPDDIEERLRAHERATLKAAKKMRLMPKHKYAWVGGVDRIERSYLRSEFEKAHPQASFDYPKSRGA